MWVLEGWEGKREGGGRTLVYDGLDFGGFEEGFEVVDGEAGEDQRGRRWTGKRLL
jgi:hypothetical protein